MRGIPAGKLRDPVTLQRPAVAADINNVPGIVGVPTGEIDITKDCNWVNLEDSNVNRRADVRSMSLEAPEGLMAAGAGNEAYFSDQVRAIATHVMLIRRDSITTQLNASCRVLWYGQALEIKAINDSGPQSFELTVALKSKG
jgi:hypothetical protein